MSALPAWEFEEKIGEQVMGMESYETPVMPKFLIMRPIDSENYFWGSKIVLIQNYNVIIPHETLENI